MHLSFVCKMRACPGGLSGSTQHYWLVISPKKLVRTTGKCFLLYLHPRKCQEVPQLLPEGDKDSRKDILLRKEDHPSVQPTPAPWDPQRT